MKNPEERRRFLRDLLQERILVLDGAMGTAIQNLGLSAQDFGGPAFEGCNEHLVLTRPDAVRSIHQGYLAAGADVIQTNTFGATRVVLAEYGLEGKAAEINRAAARLAREAADAASSAGKPRFVYGSMGPTTKSLSVTGGVSWDELVLAYREQAEALIEGGVDLLFLETVQDTRNAKAALVGIEEACSRLAVEVPVGVSGTVETMGTLLAGQDIEAFYVSLAHRDFLWFGLNCATGPDFMTDHLRTLASICRFPTVCMPNAGLPDEEGRYNETPERFVGKVERFVREGWLNAVGGCCGTTAEHIRLLAQMVDGRKPRRPSSLRRTVVSGIEVVTVDESTRPVLVGERTNVLGSRKFKQLVAEGRLEEAAEIGRLQVRRGAHILDVCLQDPDRNEVEDLTRFLAVLVKKVKVPIMIDSTDPRAIEEALKLVPGKSIVNSINLEEGEERFRRVVPLARRYGAALVVGCIDEDKEQAQAVTRERKLAIARRSYRLLTEKYGVPPEDIFFDPLVFPAGTGDETYKGSAVETIEGVRLIKKELPFCKTILGISNVSFGLPPAGREVLNAVMLYHCVQAGLDVAIVNTEKLERYPSIPPEERKLAEDLLWWRGADPIGAFHEHFSRKAPKKTLEERRNLPLDERLALAVVEGSKEGLVEDLEEALRTRTPLEIINGPLMRGMDEVGRLFARNEMIVAEVLQSAEVMKAAVSYLERYMEKTETAARGTILLATVKGDVHDIGKNLVEIILSNNGYRVVNLGIKVPPEELVRAHAEFHPDAIGLSGLLVKSAQMMVVTAQDLRAAGIRCPLLVGGAALSNRFTRLKIAPEYEGLVVYAKDAMTGLELANQLFDPERRRALEERLERETEELRRSLAATPREPEPSPGGAPAIRHDHDIPEPPDLKLHVIDDYDLEEVFSYINPVMLYTRHLGFKGRFEEALAAGDPRASELRAQVEAVEEAMIAHPGIRARAVYKFFRAHSEGDTLVLESPDGAEVLARFHFGRQSRPPYLCLADFTLPRSAGKADYVCLFATTVGPDVRKLAEEWKARGEFLRSHILQALAIEGAEGFAELLHRKIRAMWGFPDPEGTTLKDLFQVRYRGVRVSFGYPACPRLEDQATLFRLLRVEETIGVRLTEGFMMDPESSVTALVFHHPEARYFHLSDRDLERLEESLRAQAGPPAT
ncbi:MAG: methionine synthase [Candidatus Binatia bacterium]|nr:MAG: methionine synthase [Candidatus Binatia bacterium]